MECGDRVGPERQGIEVGDSCRVGDRQILDNPPGANPDLGIGQDGPGLRVADRHRDRTDRRREHDVRHSDDLPVAAELEVFADPC